MTNKAVAEIAATANAITITSDAIDLDLATAMLADIIGIGTITAETTGTIATTETETASAMHRERAMIEVDAIGTEIAITTGNMVAVMEGATTLDEVEITIIRGVAGQMAVRLGIGTVSVTLSVMKCTLVRHDLLTFIFF